MQPNPPPDSFPTSPQLTTGSSSSTNPTTSDRHPRFRRLESIRTESGKVAAEIFNASRHLLANPNDGRVSTRLRFLRQFQADLTGMAEAELMTHRPIVITGRELGPTDVPMLLAKAVLDEKAQHDEVKRLARTGQVENAREVAKDIVRNRKFKARLYALDAGNKYRTVKALVEDVDARVARALEMESLAVTATLGDDAFVEVMRFCSQLASDIILLDRYEAAVRGLLKKLAQEQQLDSGRPLAKGLLEIRGSRDAVTLGVNSLIEKATDDSLKAGIRYMHKLPAEQG
eukprot:GFKZ01013348.1.p2 GENE.GFKZ01013348.1~~GFKZ01013348.1.p2  ORF type:complete len:287 (-),score=40.53 GFKZ01013348.1:2525-3385(-)